MSKQYFENKKKKNEEQDIQTRANNVVDSYMKSIEASRNQKAQESKQRFQDATVGALNVLNGSPLGKAVNFGAVADVVQNNNMSTADKWNQILWTTAGDASMNILAGATRMAEGAIALPFQGISAVERLAGGKNDAVTDFVLRNENKLSEGMSNLGNVFGGDTSLASAEYSDVINQGIGNTLGFIAGGQALGALGLNPNVSLFGGKMEAPVLSFITGLEGGLKEANDNNYSGWQTLANGVASGAIEAFTEAIFDAGLGIGGSSLDDSLKEMVNKNVTGHLANTLAQMGLSSVGEGAEEVLGDVLDWGKNNIINYMADVFNDKNAVLMDGKLDMNQVWDDFWTTAVSTALSNAPSVATSLRTGRNFVTGFTKEQTKELDGIVEDSLKRATENNEILSRAEQAEIRNIVKEKYSDGATKQEISDAVDAFTSIHQKNLNDKAYENITKRLESDKGFRKQFTEGLTDGLRSSNKREAKQAKAINERLIMDTAKKIGADMKDAEAVARVANALKISAQYIDGEYEGAQDSKCVYINKETKNPVYQVIKHEINHFIHENGNKKTVRDFDITMLELALEKGYKLNNIANNLSAQEAYKNLSPTELVEEITSIMTQTDIFEDVQTIDDLVRLNRSTAEKIKDRISEIGNMLTGKTEKALMQKAERLYAKALQQNEGGARSQAYASSGNTIKDLITDTNNENYYDYDNLTKLPPLNLKEYNLSNIETIDKSNYEDIFKKSLDKAKELGSEKYTDKSFEVINERTNNHIFVNREASRHGAWTSANTSSATALENIYELLRDAILLNETDEINFGVKTRLSNYFNAFVNGNDLYIVRFNTKDGVYEDSDVYVKKNSVAYSGNAKKSGSLGSTTGESSRLHLPLSNLSIEQLLDEINSIEDYQNNLSKDVQNKLNNKVTSSYGKYTNRHSSGNNINELNERVKDLYAVHNIGTEQLMSSLDLGGLPMPSIAVTKDSIGHGNFGDVSLVFDKETIDPKANKDNKVYTRDAWTPMFPNTVTKVNYNNVEKAYRKIRDISNKVAPEFRDRLRNLLNEYTGTESTSKTYKQFEDNALTDRDLKIAYLEDTGYTVEPKYTRDIEKEQADIKHNADTQKLIANFKNIDNFVNEYKDVAYGGLFDGVAEKKAIIDKYEDDIKDALRNKLIDDGMSVAEANLEVEDFFKKRFRLYQTGNRIFRGLTEEQETKDYNIFDANAVNEDINEHINEADYKKWIEDNFKPMFGDRYVERDKNQEYLDRRGNRVPFNRLYAPMTAQNVVNAMKKSTPQGQAGSAMIQGHFASFMGTIAQEFGSIEDIIANEDRLVANNNVVLDDAFKELEDKYNELRNKATYDLYKYKRDDVDSLVHADWSFSYALEDMMKLKKLTPASIAKVFNENNINADNAFGQEMLDIINEARKQVTDYFEAKPRRVVNFDEVNTAVVPNTMDEASKQRLLDAGIRNIKTYDPNVEGDRNKVLNSVDTAKFSSGNTIEQLNNEVSSLRGQIDDLQQQYKEAYDNDDNVNKGRLFRELNDKIEEYIGYVDDNYMNAVANGDMDTASKLLEDYADFNGFDTPDLFHGTGKFGFTAFDLNKMDDGISIFTTSSLDTAKTYSGDVGVKNISDYKNIDSMDMDELGKQYFGSFHAQEWDVLTKEKQKEYIDYMTDIFERNVNQLKEYAQKYMYSPASIESANMFCDKLLSELHNKDYKAVKDTFREFGYNAFAYDYHNLNAERKYTDVVQMLNGGASKLLDLNTAEIGYSFVAKNDHRHGFISITTEEQARDYLKRNTKGTYRLRGKTENMLEIDGKGNSWSHIPFDEGANRTGYFTNTRTIARYAKMNGYNGVVIRNINDDGGMGNNSEPVMGDVYIYFDPSSLKSMDTVTYDDEGNVIPLSQRFQYGNEDFRFSAGNNIEELNKDYDMSSKNVVYKDSRIDAMLEDEDFTGKYADTYLVYMSPEQFIKMTAPEWYRSAIANEVNEFDEYQGGMINKEQFENSNKGNRPIDFIHLTADVRYNSTGYWTADIKGHEGRHRMQMLKNAGYESVPVLIESRRGDRTQAEFFNRENPSGEVYFLSQRDIRNDERFTDEPYLASGMTAFLKENRDKLIASFGSGNATDESIRYSAGNNIEDLNFQQRFSDTPVADENADLGNVNTTRPTTKAGMRKMLDNMSVIELQQLYDNSDADAKEFVQSIIDGDVDFKYEISEKGNYYPRGFKPNQAEFLHKDMFKEGYIGTKRFIYNPETGGFDTYVADETGWVSAKDNPNAKRLTDEGNETIFEQEGELMDELVEYAKRQDEKIPYRKKSEDNRSAEEILADEDVAKIVDEWQNKPKDKSAMKKWFMKNFVDHGYAIREITDNMRKVYKKDSKMYKLADKIDADYDAYLRADAMAQNTIGNQRTDLKTGKRIGESLNAIWSDVERAGLTNQMSQYLYHYLNIDAMTLEDRNLGVNKPIFSDKVTSRVSQEVIEKLEKEHPELKALAERLWDYEKQNAKMLDDAGFTTVESRAVMDAMYPHYIPVLRQMVDSNGQDSGYNTSNKAIKERTGASYNLMNAKVAMATHTESVYKSIAKNELFADIAEGMSANTESSLTAEDGEFVTKNIAQANMVESMDGMPAKFIFYKDGISHTYNVSQDMYDAMMKRSSIVSDTPLGNVLGKVTNLRKNLITSYNPTFILKNAIKDIQDAPANTKFAKTYAKNVAEAVAQMSNNGEKWQWYKSLGGSQDSYFNYEKEFKKDAKTPIGKAMNRVVQANELVEMMPRFAEFLNCIENGLTPEEAMLASAEITTNFKRGGDIAKELDRAFVPFLNASIQGAYRQMNNVKDAGRSGAKGVLAYLMKMTLIYGLPLGVAGAIWDDDEDYEELSDYIKQNYYIVGKTKDGKFIRIPKGRIAVGWQNMMSNAYEFGEDLFSGEKSTEELLDTIIKDVWDDGKVMFENVGINNPITNNLASPIVDVLNNRTWYGDQLIPTRLENVPNAEQYDESTDSLSKWIGERTNTSPYKINYLLDQYGGALGDVFLPMMTPKAENGVDGVLGNLLAPLTSPFVADPVTSNQNVSDFYDMKTELQKLSNSENAKDEQILAYKYMSKVGSEMSELYKQKRDIQNDPYLKDSEKYAQTRELQRQIDELAKQALNNYDNMDISGDYANIAGVEYYKKDDSWTKITDATLERMEGLSTTEKGAFISATNAINRMVDDGELKGDDKKRAVADVISGYDVSNELKGKMFSKYYDSNTTKMALAFDTDMDEFMNYYAQSFSGSNKKQDTFNYISSMNISEIQKAVLFKMAYSSYKQYDQQIVDYIVNLERSREEREELLRMVGFEIDENGNIYRKA